MFFFLSFRLFFSLKLSINSFDTDQSASILLSPEPIKLSTLKPPMDKFTKQDIAKMEITNNEIDFSITENIHSIVQFDDQNNRNIMGMYMDLMN